MSAAADKLSGYDALLDPWCIVSVNTGENHLFGFAAVHPATGGLSWVVSTELLELAPAADVAVTASGRRYRLGRQFRALDIGAEGEEPRLAFSLLIEQHYENASGLRRVDKHWLTACKMARHLDVTRPSRRVAELTAFFEDHGQAYGILQRRWRRE